MIVVLYSLFGIGGPAMNRGMVALVGIAGLLSACSGGISRTVDSPPIDVRTVLAANESTLGFTDQLVGASHSSEATEQGIVWHFMVNGQDYARYVITIADKPGGSRVSAAFEEVDGPNNSAVPFLRDTAKAASDEALVAALEHRPVKMANFQRALIVNTVRDPSKITGMQQAIVAELDNAMQDIGPGSAQARDKHHSYDDTQSYDKTQSYDRERVTQYEAERRREEADRLYGHDRRD
jgi:hypothetical protein